MASFTFSGTCNSLNASFSPSLYHSLCLPIYHFPSLSLSIPIYYFFSLSLSLPIYHFLSLSTSFSSNLTLPLYISLYRPFSPLAPLSLSLRFLDTSFLFLSLFLTHDALFCLSFSSVLKIFHMFSYPFFLLFHSHVSARLFLQIQIIQKVPQNYFSISSVAPVK